MKFDLIPQYTRRATYRVDVGWGYLEKYITNLITEDGLNIDPDFQRAHVWTKKQQIAYVEFKMRGGASGNDILTNAIGWNGNLKLGDFVLVDGKQRLEAVRKFMRNDLPVFGNNFLKDFEDKPRITRLSFSWHVNDLATRAETLRWYLEHNAGGTPHTKKELDRVRALLDKETA